MFLMNFWGGTMLVITKFAITARLTKRLRQKQHPRTKRPIEWKNID